MLLKEKSLSKIQHSTSLLGGSRLCAVSHSASCAREAEATYTHTPKGIRVITHTDQDHAIVTHSVSVLMYPE